MSELIELSCSEHGLTGAVECGHCTRRWCERCDPSPASLCHWCAGRGYSTAALDLDPTDIEEIERFFTRPVAASADHPDDHRRVDVLASPGSGTPMGIAGHLPHVPRAAGSPPWCSCGYRWDPRDPNSLVVGQHIAEAAAHIGVPNDTHWGYLR